ncbi:protein NDH-DEPENDENT CYCLIC ELECTRON FLOW 5 [Cannabis sativa]|uniref:protein NDH-DEPENDENT CYCLIC ELECTRON FLOW 5 n=1 Tax=Cannabis sativa TaxID=3483 RepID=UPI0029CA7DE1|nr:protein NDH-DEPENDENT CYCLIC ELECTRON FLOW 5 [Cannabis sativa]
MATFTSLFLPNPIHFSTKKLVTNQTLFSSSSPDYIHFKSSNDKRQLIVPRVASIPYNPINVDYLEEEFSGHGVTFQGIGDNCVAQMTLENGSTAILMLPSGLITSYKAAMWHGGTDEMLHSSVFEEEKGSASIQGGVSLVLDFTTEYAHSWSPTNWALKNISGNSQHSIQVELISSESGAMVEVKHIVTLKKDELSSEVVISNSSSAPVQLTGCVLSHLRVSSPDATYAIGLEGSDFFSRPPFSSNFGIVPPDFGQKMGFGFGQMLSQMAFWRPNNPNNSNGDQTKSDRGDSGQELEGEETDNYKHLREEMSQIYTSAPRNMTIIDRGRRNSVVVGRKGFEELYMLSPGSTHELYGKYSYICVGQSAMLKPIVVEAETVLRLGQDLHNPNL